MDESILHLLVFFLEVVKLNKWCKVKQLALKCILENPLSFFCGKSYNWEENFVTRCLNINVDLIYERSVFCISLNNAHWKSRSDGAISSLLPNTSKKHYWKHLYKSAMCFIQISFGPRPNISTAVSTFYSAVSVEEKNI